MKGFSTYGSLPVVIERGGETVSFTMRPLPWGFSDLVTEVMPAPKAPINGPVPPALQSKWTTRRLMVLLAKSLGDALDAVPPEKGAGGARWETYADAIEAEFIAANLVEGDLQVMLDTMTKLNKGGGDLPKA